MSYRRVKMMEGAMHNVAMREKLIAKGREAQDRCADFFP